MIYFLHFIQIRKFRLFSEIIEEATAEVGQGYSIKFCQKNVSAFKTSFVI